MAESLRWQRGRNRSICFIRWWARLFIGLVVVSHAAVAQSGRLQDDHLQPAPDYFSAYSYQHDYYSQIRHYLLDSLGDRPIARVVVKPSFSVEYVVSVDSSGGVIYLTYARISKSIWSYREKEALRVITTKTAIGKPLAQALNKLFFEAAAQTRYPKRRYAISPNGQELEVLSIGTDGTTYVFMSFASGHGIWSGQTWSPPKNTRMNDLVDISDALVKFVADTTDRTAKESALVEHCQTLYKKIAEPK